MSTFAPFEETGSGIFFSTGDSLHYWSASTQNQSLLLEGNVVINNLYYLNPTKVIVSRADAVSLYIFKNETLNLVSHLVCDQQQQDQLTSGNCTQTTDSKLGPTATEQSKPNILYYADGPSVYQVNMLDPNSKADEIPNLNKSLGNITAMAVSQDLLFTIHKTNSTQTFSTNNLTTSKPTRSLWSIEYPPQSCKLSISGTVYSYVVPKTTIWLYLTLILDTSALYTKEKHIVHVTPVSVAKTQQN